MTGKNDKTEKNDKSGILIIIGITGIIVTIVGTIFFPQYLERPIVTLSLGNIDDPPTVLQSDGNNYYSNIWITNAGKSSGDFNATITAINANVSFNKINWGRQESVHMMISPNNPNEEPKKIFVKPQGGVNTLNIALSYQENAQNFLQEIRIVNLNSLTYNMTSGFWQFVISR